MRQRLENDHVDRSRLNRNVFQEYRRGQVSLIKETRWLNPRISPANSGRGIRLIRLHPEASGSGSALDAPKSIPRDIPKDPSNARHAGSAGGWIPPRGEARRGLEPIEAVNF